MLIDFNQTLKDLDGVELKPDGKVMTLRSACTNALVNVSNLEKQIDGEEKVKRYNLATKVHDAKGPTDLEAEDIVKLKKLVGNIYGPLVVGQVHLLLEGKPKSVN